MRVRIVFFLLVALAILAILNSSSFAAGTAGASNPVAPIQAETENSGLTPDTEGDKPTLLRSIFEGNPFGLVIVLSDFR